MTFEKSQEATRADLILNAGFEFKINLIEDTLKAAFEAFGLQKSEDTQVTSTGVTFVAGPIAVIAAFRSQTRLEIQVQRLRDSETLHPEAETAILAEALSLLAERLGGDSVHWAAAGVSFEVERFLTAFTPLRRRGGPSRICPRRIRRDDMLGAPITFAAKPVAPVPSAMDQDDDAELKAIFAADEDDAAPEGTNLGTLSAWAATATVGVMNPAIGVPLAAYNLARRADMRISTHAFALTATLSGVFHASLGNLMVF